MDHLKSMSTGKVNYVQEKKGEDMIRPGDIFWDNFEVDDDGRWKCKFCGLKYAATTSATRIKSHILGVKGKGAKICEKVPKDVLEAAYLAIHGANKKQKTVPSSSSEEVRGTVSTASREPNNGVENIVRCVGRLQMGVQSIEHGVGDRTFSCAEVENLTENMAVEMIQPFQAGISHEGHIISAHETRGDALETTDLVAQALSKDWHGICSWLMEDDAVSCDREHMTGELMQPVGRGNTNEMLVASVPEPIKAELTTTELVGQAFEKNGREIWSWLMQDEVSRIGIYGMGGVGKTTLLKHIYDQLLNRPDAFHHVYWITASQDLKIYKFQNLVAKCVDLDLSNENDEMLRAQKLSSTFIAKHKFVLILDDLWSHFDLKEVGIPTCMKGCKLILTTRSLDVCRRMGCQKNVIKVDPLTEEEAWNLFTRQLGNYELKVEPLAKSVARECAGLPLGIQTMARSMMGVDDIHEWRNALRELRESKVRQDDMEPEVFRILKFSYIRLNDSTLQQSFLYCALFPEDFELLRENLIEYLIDEKIIEGMRSRHAQIDKGHSILNKLENVCLLESSATDRRYRCVKMHDLIRDMALQKLRENFQGMVEAGEQLEELPDEEKWTQDLLRVSLMKNQIKEIPSGNSPKCPNLSTLLLSINYELTMIADSFFTQLCGLKVLDLSFTNIPRLPDSISDLVTLTALLLQNCSSLRLVPSLAKLRALKKLDLRCTGIQEVPQGMACLSNLKYRNLHETWLKEVPAGILPNLFQLQFLRLPKELAVKGEEVACLRKLETLECHFSDLVDFSAYFKDKERQSLSAYSFRIGVTESVYVCGYKSLRGSEDFCKEVWLHNFSLSREGGFLGLPEDIQDLEITECNDVKTLSDFFPLQYAKELKSFSIERCDGMEYLLSLPGISTGILENLKTLKLKILTNLVALISRDIATPLPFPSVAAFSCLKKFEIYCCQGIKKLFHPGMLPNFQNLEVLEVAHCDKMEKIVATEELIMSEASHIGSLNGFTSTSTEFSLPKLKVLVLTHLPELSSIYYGKMICNSLQEITLLNCPKLKRMPFSLLLLNNGGQSPLPSIEKIVIYTKRWWETVEWDQPNAKNLLLPLCDFLSDDEDEIDEEDVTDSEDEID